MNRIVLSAPFVLASIVLAAIIAAIPVDVLSVPPEVAFTKFGQNLDRLLSFGLMSKQVSEMVIALLVLMVLAVIYCFPTVVSAARGKRNTAAIFVLNLLLGWTLLGWAGALVWAVMAEDPSPRRTPNPRTTP